MSNSNRIGRGFGALMLAHLALGLIGPYVVLVPMTAPPGGFLDNAAGMATATRAAVLTLMVGAALPLVIAIGLWSCLRARASALALALLCLAAANLALQVGENTLWLSMLSVSEASRDAGAAGNFAAVAIALRALFRWSHYGHILILVVWLLMLFAAFWRSALLPRWLAVSGVLACIVHLVGIPLPEFLGLRLASAALWGLPLAAVYLLSASWLLIRGLPPIAEHAAAGERH